MFYPPHLGNSEIRDHRLRRRLPPSSTLVIGLQLDLTMVLVSGEHKHGEIQTLSVSSNPLYLMS
jgi:hypothetical protein